MRMALLGLVVFLIPNIILAATLNVPGDRPSIQTAINVASNGDIILLQDGIYTGTGNCNIDFKGKSVTVKSMRGPDNCLIDCQQTGKWFILCLGETIVVEGLTICNANLSDYDDGGAVNVIGSTLIVSDCNFTNNRANNGGAVCFYNSASSFTNCIFSSNEATNSGGAIYFYSSSTDFVGGGRNRGRATLII